MSDEKETPKLDTHVFVTGSPEHKATQPSPEQLKPIDASQRNPADAPPVQSL